MRLLVLNNLVALNVAFSWEEGEGTAFLWLCFYTPWSHSFSFLPPVGLGTSSTRKPLSTAGATTHDCVQSGACASPSWTHRLGWPRTIATSGWRRGTEAQVSHTSAGPSMHKGSSLEERVWESTQLGGLGVR